MRRRRSGDAATARPKNASANRTLTVLAAFGQTSEPQNLTEISSMVGMDKSVVHRILNTLVYQQFLHQDPVTKRYRVGLRAWEIGQQYKTAATVEQVATPLLNELVQRHGGTGYIAQLDGVDIVYLALVNGPGPLRVHVRIGSRLPAYATAVGKSMLAQLPPAELNEVLCQVKFQALTPHTLDSVAELLSELELSRQRGYALNREEAVGGVASVGASINGSDLPIAGISVAFPMLPSFQHLWEVLPAEVCSIADEISRRLGGRAHS